MPDPTTPHPATTDEPELEVEATEDLSPDPGANAFLWVVRKRYRLKLQDGSTSPPFLYDAVCRRALDAVVIAPYYVRDGQRFVFLTEAIRPPLSLRGEERVAGDGPRHTRLWELPAGLIEPDEVGPEGPRLAAQRELLEEIGFDMELDAFEELGASTFPAPGIIAERHFFYMVQVDPKARRQPLSDGSVLEKHVRVREVELRSALVECQRGLIEDAKTELLLRRLEERLA